MAVVEVDEEEVVVAEDVERLHHDTTLVRLSRFVYDSWTKERFVLGIRIVWNWQKIDRNRI